MPSLHVCIHPHLRENILLLLLLPALTTHLRGFSLPILEVSRLHTRTHHSRYEGKICYGSWNGHNREQNDRPIQFLYFTSHWVKLEFTFKHEHHTHFWQNTIITTFKTIVCESVMFYRPSAIWNLKQLNRTITGTTTQNSNLFRIA